MYIRELNIQSWKQDQSEVQFPGERSSLELAVILIKETVQHYLFTTKNPIYALFINARSPFNLVLRKVLISNIYHCGTTGHSLMFINNRLESRTTCVEWEKQLMGPIHDELDVEQGGIKSSYPWHRPLNWESPLEPE